MLSKASFLEPSQRKIKSLSSHGFRMKDIEKKGAASSSLGALFLRVCRLEILFAVSFVGRMYWKNFFFLS